MSDSRLGMSIDGLWFLSPREVQQVLTRNPLLVDLRMDELVEMKTFDVPQWVHIPHDHLAEGMAGPAQGPPADPGRFLRRLHQGRGQGTHGPWFATIACLIGGMLAWDQKAFRAHGPGPAF